MADQQISTCTIDVSTARHPNSFAIIDSKHYDKVSGFKWGLSSCGKRVVCSVFDGGKTLKMQLSRVILGFGARQRIRHLNGNPLDCREENLAFGCPPRSELKQCNDHGSPVRKLYLSGVGDRFALVDADIYEAIRPWAWSVNQNGYVFRLVTIRGCSRAKTLFLHRVVMPDTSYPCVDHRDRNRLNNLRSNLRYADKPENGFNALGRARSGYKWAHFDKTCGKYHAVIRSRGVVHKLGLFKNPADAHRACAEFAKTIHGNFAEPRHVRDLNDIGKLDAPPAGAADTLLPPQSRFQP